MRRAPLYDSLVALSFRNKCVIARLDRAIQ
jgi:hypothetical protein